MTQRMPVVFKEGIEGGVAPTGGGKVPHPVTHRRTGRMMCAMFIILLSVWGHEISNTYVGNVASKGIRWVLVV